MRKTYIRLFAHASDFVGIIAVITNHLLTLVRDVGDQLGEPIQGIDGLRLAAVLFKSYNDHYGHGAGDDCLRRVAMLLKTTLKRPMDMVARYGGEAFVALLPDTDPNGARYVAEQMRSMVEAAAIPHDQSPTQPVVTLSCGVASSGGQSPKSDVAALLQCADQALYRAKQQGRNLVHACTS